MKVEHWKHVGVNEDGVVESGGAVHTEPSVKVQRGAGCNCGTCRGAGDFIVVNMGRTDDGVVSGMTIYFDSTEELDKYCVAQGFLPHISSSDN